METFVSSCEGSINRKVFMGRLNRISHNLQLYMQHHTGIPTKYYTVTVDICTSISRLKLLRVCGVLCKWSVTLHQIDMERETKRRCEAKKARSRNNFGR